MKIKSITYEFDGVDVTTVLPESYNQQFSAKVVDDAHGIALLAPGQKPMMVHPATGALLVLEVERANAVDQGSILLPNGVSRH